MKKFHDIVDVANGPGVFVVPFYGDQERSIAWLDELVDGLFAQTDSNWLAVFVDDATPDAAPRRHLRDIEERHPDKIKVIWSERNRGHEIARNIAVDWSYQQRYPFILYNDADDVSHPDRLRVVRDIFCAQPAVDLVYSTFEPVDENRIPVAKDQILPTHADYTELHSLDPIEGRNAWIRIATDSGSVGITSSTSVRTPIAHSCPAPARTPSEGIHQWMHISARGNEFKYAPGIPSQYRISSSARGSTHHRRRMGERNFYQSMIEVRTDGFLNAIDIALENGSISVDLVDSLRLKFFLRLSDDLTKVGQLDLAESLIKERVLGEYPSINDRLQLNA